MIPKHLLKSLSFWHASVTERPSSPPLQPHKKLQKAGSDKESDGLFYNALSPSCISQHYNYGVYTTCFILFYCCSFLAYYSMCFYFFLPGVSGHVNIWSRSWQQRTGGLYAKFLFQKWRLVGFMAFSIGPHICLIIPNRSTQAAKHKANSESTSLKAVQCTCSIFAQKRNL